MAMIRKKAEHEDDKENKADPGAAWRRAFGGDVRPDIDFRHFSHAADRKFIPCLHLLHGHGSVPALWVRIDLPCLKEKTG